VTGGLEVVPLAAAGPGFAAAWDALVEAHGDVYYRRDYLAVAQLNESAPVLLALFRGDAGAVLYPVVRRPLAALDLPASLTDGRCDLVTPYEYGGPLLAPSSAPDAAERLRANFDQAFSGWCRETGVVAEFIRFHPLLATQRGWSGHYDLRPSAANVVLDLSRDEETLLAGMASATRRAVRAAGNRGVALREIDAATFAKLYLAGMQRLGAAPQYYFPTPYFAALQDLEGATMLGAFGDDGALAGVAAFIAGREFAHYHLGAADRAQTRLRPMNALFFGAISWARARGCRWLHLGGGAKNQAGLRSFKEGFSAERRDYVVGTRVWDQAAYHALAMASGGDGGFFPTYRAQRRAEVAAEILAE